MSDQNLLKLAASHFRSTTSIRIDTGRWNNITAPVFVTVYKYQKPPTSANVFCCMSNGFYNNYSVTTNVSESSKVCLQKDSRHTVNETPGNIEVTIMQPFNEWRRVTNTKQLDRNKHQAIYVDGAIYLPSVWDEEVDWTTEDLIFHLKKKAGSSRSKSDIFSINVYEIDITGSRDYGFFSTLELIEESLLRMKDFYNLCLMGTGKLAYLWKKGSLIEDNEGACVRSFADVIAFSKIDNSNRPNRAFEQLLTNCSHDKVPLFEAELIFRPEKSNLRSLLGLKIPNEKSFAQPQYFLCLANLLTKEEEINFSLKELALQLMEEYEENIDIESLDGVFGLNWVAQAKKAMSRFIDIDYKDIENRLDSYLESNLEDKSTTEIACAFHGRLVLDDVKEKTINKVVRLLYNRQSVNGGFSYYPDDKLFRLDVTSHVVECFVLLHNKIIRSSDK